MQPDIEDRGSASRWWRSEVLGGIVTVVILAVVVFVAASLSPGGKASRQTSDSQSAISGQLVQRAQEALRSGDATSAAQLARQALEADASNRMAQSIEARANATKGDAGGGSAETSSGSTQSGDEVQRVETPEWATKHGADLKNLVPQKLSGYDLSQALLGENEIQISGTSTNPDAQLLDAVWTVRQMKSAKQAKSFLARTSEVLYGHDSLTPTVNGASAYYGTDGVRYATCAYVQGIYVFEVLASSNRVRPSAIRRQVIEAAKAFPDKP